MGTVRCITNIWWYRIYSWLISSTVIWNIWLLFVNINIELKGWYKRQFDRLIIWLFNWLVAWIMNLAVAWRTDLIFGALAGLFPKKSNCWSQTTLVWLFEYLILRLIGSMHQFKFWELLQDHFLFVNTNTFTQIKGNQIGEAGALRTTWYTPAF